MLQMLKAFMKDEEGLGTVEIVIIIAVLVGVALIFRNTIFKFARDLISKMFPGGTPDDNTGFQPEN